MWGKPPRASWSIIEWCGHSPSAGQLSMVASLPLLKKTAEPYREAVYCAGSGRWKTQWRMGDRTFLILGFPHGFGKTTGMYTNLLHPCAECDLWTCMVRSSAKRVRSVSTISGKPHAESTYWLWPLQSTREAHPQSQLADDHKELSVHVWENGSMPWLM